MAVRHAVAAPATALVCAAAGAGVDLHPAFTADGTKDPTPLLAADDDHPNQAGHRVIATALLAALERP